MSVQILVGDVRERLRELPDQSVQCCVTSPPYWGLRDYGHDGQIGLEQTPEAYVDEMVEVFREVRRVLRDDGTLWLNLGDSYARAGGWSNNNGLDGVSRAEGKRAVSNMTGGGGKSQKLASGLKSKDLVGIPWRVAFALQFDGWWLRQDIIWHKPNPMPESVTDRCTKAHEYVFLLAKSERYYYDNKTSAEPAIHAGHIVKASNKHTAKNGAKGKFGATALGFTQHDTVVGATRNRRSVWTITTKPFSGAHFAVMPPELAETCIKAGTAVGHTVLDPFGGAGTTGLVADQLGRDAVLIELNPEYAKMAEQRIKGDLPMFANVQVEK